MVVGVQVRTATRSGSAERYRNPGASYLVAGLVDRGDVAAPIELFSMADYVRLCGPRVTYGTLYDDLLTFFAEGGSRALVARVVGAGATVGLLSLNDRAGAPLPTLRIDAASPGAWSAGVTVQVENGLLVNTYRLTVRALGYADEVYDNLASPADGVAALARSAHVRGVNLGSATASPNNNPAVLAATALSAGNDQRASVVAATYVTALARFTPEWGDGAVAIPGQPHASVGAGLIGHVQAHRRIALLAAPLADSLATTQAAAKAFAALGAGTEHAGLFWPWVSVPDSAGAGARTISPEGYVAGVRARTIDTTGPWRAAAGDIARARTVLDVATKVTRAEADAADADGVSVIRHAGGVRLYGWRSLSADRVNYWLLSARDLMNRVVVEAETALEGAPFAVIDSKGQVFSRVTGAMIGILEPIRAAGGLYELTNTQGDVVDPGYSVDAGPGINTAATKAAGEIHVQVVLRPSPSATLVDLLVIKTPLTGTV